MLVNTFGLENELIKLISEIIFFYFICINVSVVSAFTFHDVFMSIMFYQLLLGAVNW